MLYKMMIVTIIKISNRPRKYGIKELQKVAIMGTAHIGGVFF
jgi:hypothetical protein